MSSNEEGSEAGFVTDEFAEAGGEADSLKLAMESLQLHSSGGPGSYLASSSRGNGLPPAPRRQRPVHSSSTPSPSTGLLNAEEEHFTNTSERTPTAEVFNVNQRYFDPREVDPLYSTSFEQGESMLTRFLRWWCLSLYRLPSDMQLTLSRTYRPFRFDRLCFLLELQSPIATYPRPGTQHKVSPPAPAPPNPLWIDVHPWYSQTISVDHISSSTLDWAQSFHSPSLPRNPHCGATESGGLSSFVKFRLRIGTRARISETFDGFYGGGRNYDSETSNFWRRNRFVGYGQTFVSASKPNALEEPPEFGQEWI